MEPEDEGERVLCLDNDEPEPERVSPGSHEGETEGAACFSDLCAAGMDLPRICRA